ncbi:KAT8 regulatory NSL complex subunit 1-like [Pecten maximus]|uniref:KAT8 regulatory NSL complex subunit 1-like n=1 Tax=Pecten maximus TaxID=6579 RepID=UPI00145887EB|nr:KAT8 regulatory NSL complex subunit 1-like [Pecten maximus]
MSVPLSLRVCCMAAMAPALTEAATQARIKLSESPPPAPPELPTPILNGNGLTHHKAEKVPTASSEREKLSATCAKGKQGRGIVGFTSHLTLQQLQQAHKQGLLKPVGCKQITAANLKHLKLVQKLPQISQEHSLSFSVLEQNSNQIDVDEKMNKTNSVNETKSTGKQGGLISQIKREDFQIPEKRNIPSIKQSLNVKDFSLTLGEVAQHTSNSKKETDSKTQHTAQVNNSITSSGSDMVASMGNGPDVSETPISKSKEQTETVCESGVKKLKLSEQVGRKQHVLERRTQALLRRLRRIQGNHLEGHVRNQLSSFVNFQNSNLQTVAKTIKSSNSNNNDLKTDLFQSEDVKSLSTAALVNLVRKLQSSNNNNKTSLQRLVSQTKTEKDIVSQGVLSIDEETCTESSRVAGHLTMNLKHAQSAIDSDATESSSGGESCDEDDIYYDRDPKATLNPLHRRAEWKWATDRAAVASRWTWLQAQVSDLEYRIRQQSEIFKQIRHTKGSVILGEAPSPEDLSIRLKQARAADSKLSPLDAKIANLQKKNEASPCNISTLLMNVNVQATKLTKSLGNCLSPAQGVSNSNNLGDNNKLRGQQNHSAKPLNGMIGQSHEHGSSETSSDAPSTPHTQVAIGPAGDSVASTPENPTSPFPPDMTCQAARCRPVRSYRKRKLLWTSGLHQRSRKAARLSTVRCECYPPKSSCPMCGGRYNNTQSVNPDNMPIQERVSILDPAFHPVLSFTQEIPLPIHFEALLKSGEWQNKPPPKSAKALATERRRQKLMSQQRVNKKTKYAKGAAAALLSSAKLRNKYERRTPTKPRSGGLSMTPKKSAKERRLARSDMKRRRVAQLAMALKQSDNLSLSYTDGYSGMDGKNVLTSPLNKEGGTLSSSAPSSTLKEMKEAQWRRRRESEYDINNIVIPYSMAASTRVEKLQYKEIVTPKWRDLTKDDVEVHEEEEEEEVNPSKEMETESEKTMIKEEAVVPKESTEEEEEEVEDLTDESFIERHKICEVQEKKRFTSFIQYPSRRQRGSRGEDQPRTPAMTDDIQMDISVNEPILPLTSSLSTSPSPTPQVQAFKDEAFRRRSSSASSRRLSMSASMDENSRDSQLFEMVEMCSVDPWPERTFPLTEEEYEQMKMVQPPAIRVRRARISSTRISLMSEYSSSHHPQEDSMSGSSHPCSPLPSTSSGSVVGEDPNDPEWMISGEKDKEKAPPKQSVILKLKR